MQQNIKTSSIQFSECGRVLSPLFGYKLTTTGDPGCTVSSLRYSHAFTCSLNTGVTLLQSAETLFRYSGKEIERLQPRSPQLLCLQL